MCLFGIKIGFFQCVNDLWYVVEFHHQFKHLKIMSRPEHSFAPNIFYDAVEAKKYSTSSRMLAVQKEITNRAIELLNLPKDGIPRLLLDIGCGSGLSGEVLT